MVSRFLSESWEGDCKNYLPHRYATVALFALTNAVARHGHLANPPAN
jgi:hypothetical protein